MRPRPETYTTCVGLTLKVRGIINSLTSNTISSSVLSKLMTCTMRHNHVISLDTAQIHPRRTQPVTSTRTKSQDIGPWSGCVRPTPRKRTRHQYWDWDWQVQPLIATRKSNSTRDVEYCRGLYSDGSSVCYSTVTLNCDLFTPKI